MEKKEILDYILVNSKWFAREDVFKKLFSDTYADIQGWWFPENFKFPQRLYHYLNDDSELNLGLCRVCGKRCTFMGINNGYRNTCSNRCNTRDQVRKDKYIETSIKRYGTKYPMQNNGVKEHLRQVVYDKYGVDSYRQTKECEERIKRTCLEKYGVEHYFQSEDKKEKTKATYIERYGVENNSQTDEWKESFKKTCLERYGVENSSQNAEIQKRMSDGWKRKSEAEIAEIVAKERATCMERYGTDSYSKTDEYKQRIIDASVKKYGVEHPTQSNKIKEKVRQTCLERYGVEWACMRPEARTYSAISKINLMFTELLKENDVIYEMEFPLESYCYDFKVGDTLIEINPTITHNSFLNVFGGEPKASDYHLLKSKCASDNGYHCIHVWDWDDWNKIISMLKPKETLYARKLELREVSESECNAFLNKYHLQGSCKGQAVRLGLYMNDILVEAMTFGKPRYNKHYEYELLRLCSHSGYIVVGGAERLFKYFTDTYKPVSVISYCDSSKFDGNVYTRLGFTLKSVSNPSKHWWDSKQHITDNLLRQRGFDQLFNANYGKGTNNEELMIEHGFLPVYDCGQITFIYKDEKL